MAKLRGEQLVRITCEGITPLLMHQMAQDRIIQDLIYSVRKPKVKDLPLRKIAEAGLYTGPNGEYGIPQCVLFACLRNGGELVKFDTRSKVSTQKSTKITLLLSVIDEFVPLTGDPELSWFFETQPNSPDLSDKPPMEQLVEPSVNGHCPWVVDVQRGQMSSGMKTVSVGIVRPKFNHWGFTANLMVDYDLTSEETVRDIIKFAGKGFGLMSFRPQCRGIYGQFKLVDYEVLTSYGQ